MRTLRVSGRRTFTNTGLHFWRSAAFQAHGPNARRQVFDAIATDESVLTGLAAAHLLKDAVNMKSGQVPNELLLQLKQGPAKHIKNHAFAYRRKVNAELTKIGRIRDLQQRAVALTGTVIIAASVSAGNVLGRLYYGVLRADSTLAGIIAGVAIGTVLLVCASSRRRLRPQGAGVNATRESADPVLGWRPARIVA